MENKSQAVTIVPKIIASFGAEVGGGGGGGGGGLRIAKNCSRPNLQLVFGTTLSIGESKFSTLLYDTDMDQSNAGETTILDWLKSQINKKL
jgi:hypothetical protein